MPFFFWPFSIKCFVFLFILVVNTRRLKWIKIINSKITQKIHHAVVHSKHQRFVRVDNFHQKCQGMRRRWNYQQASNPCEYMYWFKIRYTSSPIDLIPFEVKDSDIATLIMHNTHR